MDRRLAYLQALGVPVYVRRGAAPAAAGRAAGAVDADVSGGGAGDAAPVPGEHSLAGHRVHIAGLGWTELESEVRECRACGLCASRTQTVFGVGDRAARLMVIGEAPGADEDRQGEPFVGRAGQLLNAMLRAAGFDRSQVYIANVLKCRPPGNRDPKPEEAGRCLPYLYRQIDLVAPRLILCVGRIAAHNLLDTDTPLGRLRGRVHPLGPRAVPVVVTYHPAYLLRTPGDKRKAWEDLKFALECMRHGHCAGSPGTT